MKGDVFSATSYYMPGNQWNFAEGDIFSAIGDIMEPCELDLPYPDSRLQMLRDTVELRRETWAQAKAARDIAYKDWADCKRKLFCNAGPKNSTLNAREGEEEAARVALESAEKNLSQAVAANEDAEDDYRFCVDQYARIMSQQSKIESEEQKLDIEEQKVSTVKLETSKDYAKYGLIGLGVAGLFVFGYLIFKK
jgi:hypothetical protein